MKTTSLIVAKTVYLAHPVSGLTTEVLIASISGWITYLKEAFPDYAFSVPWLASAIAGLECGAEGDTAYRERAMRDDKALVLIHDEIWLLGDRITKGMSIEAHAAHTNRIPVYQVTRRPRLPTGDMVVLERVI